MAALQTGSRVGLYEILAPLGTGGMGEVYRSRDTRLKREVAIKVLPAEFSRDPERLRRFRREAELLATLNHSHVAQIYGLEETEDTLCLVLELVEGETLADRLKRGPMPVDEALEIASQIAEALEAAHARDIVHRDLKPGNIMITSDGQVKVLDFGLAKPLGPDSPDAGASQSPTLASATIPGMILGTAAYMSPEQAKGRAAETRSDIWAFGCVLYEMLIGRRAFTGETVVEILGAILKSEPDWTALPKTTPPAILSLLKRCLQKDRNRRMRDIADARFQIEEASNEPALQAASVAPPRRSRERVLWFAVVLALVFGLGISLVYNRSTPTAMEMRLEITTPPGSDLSGFAISPDGGKLVFQATAEGKSQLWLRPLDSETAQPLAGTENGAIPFWSPDSRSVGFVARGQLKRIDIAAGIVQTLADAPFDVLGGAWSAEGTILFTQSSIEPLYRVPASGGKAVAATEVKAPHRGHRFPHFLPDGRHFLFFAFGPPESQGVYVGSLDSKESKRLLEADSSAVFSPPDYLLFARQGAVLAQHMDLKNLQMLGDPLPVAKQVATPYSTVASVALSAAMTGPVAYRAETGERQLRWVGRYGQHMGLLGDPDPAQPSSLRLSPDGRTVALLRMVSGNLDVWLMETARDARQRFTSDPAREFDPVWSPDGSRIVFGSTRKKGVLDLYERSVSGAGTETVLWESPESKNVYDWSSDGRWLLFATQSPKTARDLWVLPMDGEKKPISIAQTAAEESVGRFSPDGRWIAYQSNASGRNEIYIQPFPGPGGTSQISTGGGLSPQWRRDGKELFYLGPDNRLMAVPVALNGSRVEPGTPVALFSLSPGGFYTASTDGQRFLINEITKEAAPITILLNWRPR